MVPHMMNERRWFWNLRNVSGVRQGSATPREQENDEEERQCDIFNNEKRSPNFTKQLTFYRLLANDCCPHDELKGIREVHLLQRPHFKEWDI